MEKTLVRGLNYNQINKLAQVLTADLSRIALPFCVRIPYKWEDKFRDNKMTNSEMCNLFTKLIIDNKDGQALDNLVFAVYMGMFHNVTAILQEQYPEELDITQQELAEVFNQVCLKKGLFSILGRVQAVKHWELIFLIFMGQGTPNVDDEGYIVGIKPFGF